MKRFAILFLTLAAFAHAGDPPKIEAEVKAKPGRLLKLSASAPTAIKWINTSDTADLIPDSNGKSAIFFPTVPGRYKIAVYTADAKDGPSDPAYCTVIVEGEVPPVPVPVPTPTDALTTDLKALFQAEPVATRAQDAAKLAGVYRAAAVIADDAKVATVGKLNELIQDARKVTVADTALVPLRKRIAPELTALGTDPNAALTPVLRATAKTTFTRIATSLEACK